MPEQIPQLLKMPHCLLSAFSRPLPPWPGVIIMLLESRNHDLFLISITSQHLEKRRLADNRINRIEKKKKADMKGFPGSISSMRCYQTATSCSIYTALKSVIHERMFLTVDIATFSACFVRLFLALHRIPNFFWHLLL